MTAQREVELKLSLPARFASALLAHASVKRYLIGQPRTKRLRSVYFDTQGERLAAEGIALRVRSVGDRFVQTLKCGERAASGLFDRCEDEAEVASMVPDLDAVDDAVLRDAVASALGGAALAPHFETDMERVQVDQRDGDDAWELDLDRGEIIAGTKREPISEVELELRAGSPVRLFDAALDLVSDLPLVPGGLSKAARGYAIVRGEMPSDAIEAELLALADVLATMPDAAALASSARKLAEDASRSEEAAARVRVDPQTSRLLLEAGRLRAQRLR